MRQPAFVQLDDAERRIVAAQHDVFKAFLDAGTAAMPDFAQRLAAVQQRRGNPLQWPVETVQIRQRPDAVHAEHQRAGNACLWMEGVRAKLAEF